ncbi:L-seryl-tRNA(Sec) selenium transferase [Aquincola tertiaricarbonis]|uniref:L-seryl-tRNA(Sec) selenium transferase n=1 Tax=Aquincola tertiaricarbonis TaxID=391953 RepID=A0ABY4SAG6_AQUTE|nr:L-seryl-tRNA(Sec) selenium transferase [Aquincola tertiaricarbonis]URI08733.1 L-seryl-tRNA(Sec) selenium transferase [Aquincola tertiaricarbonis]
MNLKVDESMVHGSKALLQQLPSIDRIMQWPAAQALVAAHGHTLVAGEARALVAARREAARAGTLAATALQPEALAADLRQRCGQRLAPRLKPVLNLTGTVIHTNLGRSVLADEALAHILRTMAGTNNLEFDLDSGGRGDRDTLVEDLLCEITGAEAATVVNNNAGAVLLTIAALAHGREAIVSRGELVEIGGAFRMPDVMASAGARMVEVGTTNRTHPADYQQAFNERTALVMKVHTSNYAVQGFTSSVDEAVLAPLCRARGVPLATDLGSGSLIDLAAYGLPREPLPQEMLRAGCDVVTFSGDKLLGGPQAGLIVGSKAAVGRIRKYPMKRALRMSKLPLAALEATLMLYLQPERLVRDLPTLRHLTRSQAQILVMAEALKPVLARALAPRFEVGCVALSSQIGSGSLPVDRLPSAGLAIGLPGSGDKGGPAKGVGTALDELARALRGLPLPVVGRIAHDRLLLDLRCLDDAEPLAAQLPALREALGMGPLNT